MTGIIGWLLPYKKWFIGGAVLLAISASVMFYVNRNENIKADLMAQIAVLQANEAVYKLKFSAQEQAIDFLEKERERVVRDFEAVSEEFKQIEEQNFTFQERIEQLELSRRALESPEATEVFINEITKNLNRCFEIASGATLTEKERNAKNGQEFNTECPYLFDGSNRN